MKPSMEIGILINLVLITCAASGTLLEARNETVEGDKSAHNGSGITNYTRTEGNYTFNATENGALLTTTSVPPSTEPPVVELDGGCDFDEGFCGWTNYEKDDFDWLLNTGRTGSSSTGPEHDVSNNKTGYYALIEGSWPRQPGHVARLHSPPLTGIRCMRFYYSMYGYGIGDLRVFLVEGKNIHFLWGRYRDQGQGWRKSNVTVYGDKGYVVAFFGRRGKAYTSDMAIDNITFVSGTCDGKPLVDLRRVNDVEAAHIAVKGEPGTCDFDGGWCEWTNVLLDDQFDWQLKGGMTGTADTGPEKDHTGVNGKYIYIESSQPAQRGQRAQILGPRLCGEMCMQFYYHMYGHQIGTLNIYKRIGLKNLDRIWTLSGEQGQDWNEALISINGNCYQIVIEGVIGDGYLGDAAIDDVIFTKGDCCAKTWRHFDVKAAGNCAFGSGLCNWTNSNQDDFDWILHEGATKSNFTGPNASVKGPYAYVEASEPRMPGDKAILVGPVLRGQVCMRFKYHMYGDHVGSLTVYKHGSGVQRHQMWRKTGNRGNIWRDAYVNFRCDGPLFQVEIEAIVNGWRSDIAIDEITFDHSICPVVPDARMPITISTLPVTPFPISSGNCTFPDNFCDWVNDRADDIEWELASFSASLGTGPKRDVDGNGKYIFIEASRYRYRQQAKLVSGYMRGQRCMCFHYHMMGRSVGILKIHQIDVKTGRESRVWYRSGRQREGWIRAYLNLQGNGYRIAFIAVRGERFHGDIAIDDIFTTPGKCKQLLETPFRYQPPKSTRIPIPFKDRSENCNFDDGHMCKWRNVGGDQFDWKLWKGSTPSRYTGPTSDRSGKGMYIYIEASPPRINQDNAFLSLITGGPARCLRFYYYMYGKDTGELKVHTTPTIGRDRKMTLLWEIKGEQGDEWKLAQVDVPPARTYALIIEGTRGLDFKGDTALDDITLVDGPCSTNSTELTATHTVTTPSPPAAIRATTTTEAAATAEATTTTSTATTTATTTEAAATAEATTTATATTTTAATTTSEAAATAEATTTATATTTVTAATSTKTTTGMKKTTVKEETTTAGKNVDSINTPKAKTLKSETMPTVTPPTKQTVHSTSPGDREKGTSTNESRENSEDEPTTASEMEIKVAAAS